MEDVAENAESGGLDTRVNKSTVSTCSKFQVVLLAKSHMN